MGELEWFSSVVTASVLQTLSPSMEVLRERRRRWGEISDIGVHSLPCPLNQTREGNIWLIMVQ